LKRYKYAIEHHKKLYPPKYILSKITNISTIDFSGGEQTNVVFEDLGFKIIELNDKTNSHLNLLEKKKQVILYGPPGTGKTYITKKFAVSILGGIDYLKSTVVDEDDLNYGIGNISNPLFNDIHSMVNQVPSIRIESKKSMIAFNSLSKRAKKYIGLVWLEYPTNEKSAFKVHLRKESSGSYPKELTDKVSNYEVNGWGGYPSLSVKDKKDAEITIQLINYASEHF
jgi:hypothetical protein